MDSLANDSTALSTRIIPDDAARSHWPMLEQRGEWLAIYASESKNKSAMAKPPRLGYKSLDPTQCKKFNKS